MKRRFTILTAAFALLAILAIPMGMMGQTRESYTATYAVTDLEDMFEDGSSYASANGYWKVPESAGNFAMISIPITQQPTSDISVKFHIATFGSGTNPAATNTTITAVGTESNSNWSGTGVSAYPSSSTYVDGVMTIAMPNNPTTLSGLEITMGVSSGVKIFRLQSITVEYTYGGGTPTPTTYTVTYDCNGGTSGCPENVTDLEAGDEITLADGPVKTDYDFAGWSDGNTTYDEGDTYTVNGNVTFTAQWTEQSSGDVHWVLTDLANLTTNDVFVIVGNNGSNYAMKNTGASNSGPVVVAVTVSGNELTGTIGDDIRWNVSGDATNGYIFYPNGSSTTWLYCIDNNNGLRIGSGNTDYNTFKIQSDYIYNIGRSRYVGIYSSQDWRSYTSINNNIKNQTFAFYKKVTGDVLPPSITANNVNIAFNATSGEIEYTLNNPVETATLIANTNDSWLTLGAVGSTSVPFTCSTNTETAARTATVTLSYVNGEATLVTKEVTVTQGAAPVSYTTIPDLFAAATSTETPAYVTFNNWVVSGVSTNGKNVFVTDNNGNGFVIYGTDMNNDYAVGDILSGTAVSCTLKKYNGFAELINLNAEDLTITSGGTVSTANVAMADLAGVNTGALVHYEGLICSVDNNKYYLTDGTTTLQVYNTLFAFDALEDGKTYNITGIYQQYNNTKEILPRSAADIEEVQVQHNEYTLTVDNLVHVTTYVFDASDQSEALLIGAGQVDIYDGTEVMISVDVEEGYVIESLIVDGVDVTSQIDADAYTFTMPTNAVTVTATAVEYVAPTPGDKYVKVTSTADLTSGQYLIVYEEGSVAFDGSLETLDAASNTIEVILNNDEIDVTSETAASEFTIDMTAGTIMSASENYIGRTGDSNGMNTSTTEAYTNSISIDDSGNAVVVASGGAYLRYNATSGQDRFRYFKSSSYTNQKAIQLYKKVENTPAEYTLAIEGYGNSDGGYYLIASPVTVDPSTVGMTTGEYDLYSFDQAQDDEWRNYKAGAFTSLEPGKGYLYAHKTDGEFTLTGTAYNGDGTIELTYDDNAIDFKGWNLVGNPWGEKAYPNHAFYTMAEGGAGIDVTVNVAGTEVAAMTGIFVVAEAANETVTFSKTATGKSANLALNITNSSKLVDRAIVSFGEGRQLPKFQLNPNHTKVYFEQNGKDLAVVNADEMGEMPVSFKAENNGTYTINVNTENVEMDYLHLIDNMTGADIDLLANPSYSFDAKVTDYTSRFRLVFSANNGISEQNSETFAFFNGNDWTINNEGEATLQVVDMTGRVLSTETVNGNATTKVNAASGVYMLRLINGNNIKTQKVVVK